MRTATDGIREATTTRRRRKSRRAAYGWYLSQSGRRGDNRAYWGNPNDAGESPEPAPREAQVGFAPGESPGRFSDRSQCRSLDLDWVTATLEAKSRPPGDDFADRTCAPYIIRAAREFDSRSRH